MELRKSGFTLAEFMISITAMLVVMAAALPITFNKVKTDRKNIARIDGQYYFSCNGTNIKNCSGNSCVFEILPKEKIEFAHIRLVGGGGAGGVGCPGGAVCRGGTSGEVKNIVLPYMQGKYKIVLGSGGDSPGKNGEPTALYRILGSSEELIASAAGGISTNEAILYDEDKNGEVTETGCGNGGGANNGGKGTKGGVEITW